MGGDASVEPYWAIMKEGAGNVTVDYIGRDSIRD